MEEVSEEELLKLVMRSVALLAASMSLPNQGRVAVMKRTAAFYDYLNQ